MNAIFISYRREDSSEVLGRIYDRLTAVFPREAVFRDLDSIRPGALFPETLREAIAMTRVGLVVIGPVWLTVTDSNGLKRLFAEEDFVRAEVEALLAAGIPVVPCLVRNAALPRAEELPPTIRRLAHCQLVQVRPDPDFHRDMDALIAALASHRIEKRNPAASAVAAWFLVLAVAGALVVSVWVGWQIGFSRDPLLATIFLVVLPLVNVTSIFRILRRRGRG